jgi:urea transport system ATP-binding protein
VFESHSVRDNIVLALAGGREPGVALFGRESAVQTERIEELLRIIRLSEKASWPASKLSHGQKQWLEIGMLLAQEPKLLLVDEPAAGMTDAETAETAVLLKEIAKTKTVIVVEHDMAFVRDLGVKVTVLHEGSVLSEGSLDHVSADPKVIEVYLGR